MKSAHKNHCLLRVGCNPAFSTSCIPECCAQASPALTGHRHLMGAGRSPRIHLAHSRKLREGIPVQPQGDAPSRLGPPGVTGQRGTQALHHGKETGQVPEQNQAQRRGLLAQKSLLGSSGKAS